MLLPHSKSSLAMSTELAMQQMAQAFDDLAAGCTSGVEVEPRRSGEEMALHLAVARARTAAGDGPAWGCGRWSWAAR
ncbi:hypothetical protein ACFRDV_41285 [Streptomyces fagopyri]|uniref:hypothetical protein n=1 Tax=Streptomyces fagopyri TaxID=2662397 RepID=UPI00368A5CF1